MVLNILLFLVGASVYGGIIRAIDPTAGPSLPGMDGWWSDLYRGVLSVVLGQTLPPDDASGVPSQTFAVAVSVLGLASFALVLALMEQVSWACS